VRVWSAYSGIDKQVTDTMKKRAGDSGMNRRETVGYEEKLAFVFPPVSSFVFFVACSGDTRNGLPSLQSVLGRMLSPLTRLGLSPRGGAVAVICPFL
jgi:hypothetical protein